MGGGGEVGPGRPWYWAWGLRHGSCWRPPFFGNLRHGSCWRPPFFGTWSVLVEDIVALKKIDTQKVGVLSTSELNFLSFGRRTTGKG